MPGGISAAKNPLCASLTIYEFNGRVSFHQFGKEFGQVLAQRVNNFEYAVNKISDLGLPFAHLNLRLNPFGAVTPVESAKLAIVNIDLQQFISRLQKPGFAIQFMGPSGRGKTTHLFVLYNHFSSYPYTYIPPDAPIPEIPDTPVQFIDEMQRIGRKRRKAILGRQASFVIGSHKSHRQEFIRAGLDYEVVRLQGLSVERLVTIIERRIEWARRDPDLPIPFVSMASAANLIATFGDDLWAIENYLYDVFQELQEAGEVVVKTPGVAKRLQKVIRASVAMFDQFRYG